jgi:hypothetical protein
MLLTTGEDPNVAGYVSRRVAKGFTPVEQGSIYDIISKICDHELAEIITNKMRRHSEEPRKEKEQRDRQDDEDERGHDPNQAAPQPPNRPRQSLGEYYIAHPAAMFHEHSPLVSPEKSPQSPTPPDDDGEVFREPEAETDAQV